MKEFGKMIKEDIGRKSKTKRRMRQEDRRKQSQMQKKEGR